MNTKLLTEALGPSEILTFELVQEALEYFASADYVPPDLVLLDINFPVMNAWDFLEALPQHNIDPETLPLVLLSSFLSPEDREKIVRYGMEQAVLIKPLKIAELLRLPLMK